MGLLQMENRKAVPDDVGRYPANQSEGLSV